jgi:hypothetical protein
MLPTDRIAYSAITERAPLKLPDGARMAVWVIVNVEEWNPREPMPRTAPMELERSERTMMRPLWSYWVDGANTPDRKPR